MASRYIDFDLIKQYPNKYNITPEKIIHLKILNWSRLKEFTWNNEALKSTGTWWCHMEGCNLDGKYDDSSEFWIGFREEDNCIHCSWTCYEGMCRYIFKEFYKIGDIENDYDMNVQVNTIRWLNEMIDGGILGIVKEE